MKLLFNILLFTLVLVLIFILLNTSNEHDMFSPESTMILTEGVDFSSVNTRGHSNAMRGRNQSFGDHSLLSAQQGLLYSKNDILSENLNVVVADGSSNNRARTPIAYSSNQPSMASGNASYGIAMNKNSDSRTAGGMGSTAINVFGGARRHNSGNAGVVSTGLQTGFSESFGGGGRMAVPPNPATDYFANDITHPGGNPMGDPFGNNIPVGSGTLPLLCFISLYILWLHKKQS